MAITKKVNSNANVKQFSDADLQNHITQVAGGSSGGINYINNPGAETDTSGWATYQNTAQAAPVTGTGGSPNVTLSRTTTNPLRGIGSFLFSKDAANRQGQGVSYDFTIDSADKAKVLSIQFDYIVVSGSFNAGSPSTDSDIEMWVYDKTNNALIAVTPFKLESNSSIDPGTFKATFQTAPTSTSYRLILHVATTNASAWSFAFDNVIVGPQAILNAPSIGDWVAYTPSFSSGFGTVTGVFARYRRVGDSAEIEGLATTGTVTSGAGLISLPPGLSIDYSKFSAPGVAGVTSTTAPGGTFGITNMTILVADSVISPNEVFLSNVGNGSTPVNLTEDAVNTCLAGSTPFSFRFTLPIMGWSSNTVTGNDADARAVSLGANKTSPQSLVNSTFTKVTWDAVDFDTHAAFDFVNNRYIAPVTGYYHVSVCLEFNNSSSVGLRQSLLFKNGTTYAPIGFTSPGTVGTGNAEDHVGSAIVQLNAGDYLEVWAQQQSGGSLSIAPSGADFNRFMVQRISGPALPLASESVAAVYYVSPATVTFTSGQPSNFDFKVIDTHGAVVTGSSWKFTAPVSGNYRIDANAQSASVSASLRVFKNGSAYSYTSTIGTGGISAGGVTMPLVAGDFIDIRTDTTFTAVGPQASAITTQVSIYQVK